MRGNTNPEQAKSSKELEVMVKEYNDKYKAMLVEQMAAQVCSMRLDKQELVALKTNSLAVTCGCGVCHRTSCAWTARSASSR